MKKCDIDFRLDGLPSLKKLLFLAAYKGRQVEGWGFWAWGFRVKGVGLLRLGLGV